MYKFLKTIKRLISLAIDSSDRDFTHRAERRGNVLLHTDGFQMTAVKVDDGASHDAPVNIDDDLNLIPYDGYHKSMGYGVVVMGDDRDMVTVSLNRKILQSVSKGMTESITMRIASDGRQVELWDSTGQIWSTFMPLDRDHLATEPNLLDRPDFVNQIKQWDRCEYNRHLRFK